MKPEDVVRIKELLPTTLGTDEIREQIAADILRRSVFSARMADVPYLSLERAIPVKRPRKDWPERWKAAGEACHWVGALLYGTDKKHPMMARAHSPIWKELAKGRGGFRDAIDADEPPFAINSGLRWYSRILNQSSRRDEKRDSNNN